MDKSYKRKNYYSKPGGNNSNNWNNSKKKFKNYLTAGMTGFLCTCNFQNREKDCIRESMKLLEEYTEKLTEPTSVNVEEVKAPNEEDIEAQLEQEVASLRTNGGKSQAFSVVDTGVKSIVFISANTEDPVKLARAILDEAAETKVAKSRFLLRIIPVEVVCKANLEDIKVAAEALFAKRFCCEPTTFAVVINKRCNDKFLRDEVIHALALLVTDRNPDHKANLKEPQKTVLVEVIKGLCCISVLEDYKKLKHYNIAELTKQETEEKSDAAAAGGDNAGDNVEDGAKEDNEDQDCDQDAETEDEPAKSQGEEVKTEVNNAEETPT